MTERAKFRFRITERISDLRNSAHAPTKHRSPSTKTVTAKATPAVSSVWLGVGHPASSSTDRDAGAWVIYVHNPVAEAGKKDYMQSISGPAGQPMTLDGIKYAPRPESKDMKYGPFKVGTFKEKTSTSVRNLLIKTHPPRKEAGDQSKEWAQEVLMWYKMDELMVYEQGAEAKIKKLSA
jgi:hypothetical protein